VATRLQQAQAFPSLRQTESQSQWQRIVAAFKRISFRRNGDVDEAPAILESVEANDRELSALAQTGRRVPEDRFQHDLLVYLYVNGLHG
jgi:hypothetical protein